MSSGSISGLFCGGEVMGGVNLGASNERPRLTLHAPIRRTELAVLCSNAHELMVGRIGEVLECDVEGITEPDLETVEALACVELTAMRLGSGIRLRGASVELLEVLALCGLPFELVLEAEGQAEQREEARGVEEEGDPADPVT
jgi:STAS domain